MKRLLAILLITMISYLDASVSNASQTLLSDLSKNTYILRDLKLTSLGTRYLETAHNITTDNIPNNCPINMSGFSRISSYYGMRKHPIFKYTRFHSGIDLAGSYNTEIYATADGVIEKARYYPGYGRMVTVDHGNGIKTLYAHLNKYTVEKGQRVSQGDCIGLLGSSGVSTGPHLRSSTIG